MSANTVTEELKAPLRASIDRHRAFPDQERIILDRINVLLGMVSTLRSLSQAVGGHTGLGMEMSQFSTAIATQAQGMTAIIQQMRSNLDSINAEPLKHRLDDLLRATIGVAIPDLYTTQTALDFVTQVNNLNNELTTLDFGSMAYVQQVNQYVEEVYPGTERRF
ncbi:hypothetical protein FMUND_6722 [Fusarium mundagurra]|uniref:Uncharacterized protein n=1 Tax=Fusarium mundagurra TaxID=1567541 RepID=A0A8H5YN73_9HYPO|nr:hypothetical protein FMUND_6722 [Fusarium mundagurra]